VLLRRERPRELSGAIVAFLSVAAVTGLIHPLKHVAPPSSLSVVYLLACWSC